MKKISLCTTCKGRLRHLRETLPRNIADNADHPDVEFVVLDYKSGDGLADFLRGYAGRVRAYRLVSGPDEDFLVAHAKNICGLLATGDVVCNVDADHFTGPGFAAHVDAAVSGQRTVLIGGEHAGVESTGRLAYTRAFFLTLGGYDERLRHGWGYEDNDFRERAVLRGANLVCLPAEHLRFISHGDEERSGWAGGLPHTESDAIHRRLSEEAVAAGVWRANKGVVWGSATVDVGYSGRLLAVDSSRAGRKCWS